MQSGKLRNLAEIQRSTDGTWAKLKDKYVGIIYNSGSEIQDYETGYNVTNVRIKGRIDSDITTRDRIILFGKTYYIESILPDPDNGRQHVYDCAEREQ